MDRVALSTTPFSTPLAIRGPWFESAEAVLDGCAWENGPVEASGVMSDARLFWGNARSSGGTDSATRYFLEGRGLG